MGIRTLSGTLIEALTEMKKDPIIREALGEHITSTYIKAKEIEWEMYRTQVQVDEWERLQYLKKF